eukprot:gene867-biopygen2155
MVRTSTAPSAASSATIVRGSGGCVLAPEMGPVWGGARRGGAAFTRQAASASGGAARPWQRTTSTSIVLSLPNSMIVPLWLCHCTALWWRHYSTLWWRHYSTLWWRHYSTLWWRHYSTEMSLENNEIQVWGDAHPTSPEWSSIRLGSACEVHTDVEDLGWGAEILGGCKTTPGEFWGDAHPPSPSLTTSLLLNSMVMSLQRLYGDISTHIL